MATVRTNKTCDWRTAVVLWPHNGWSPPYRRCRSHAGTGSPACTYWMGACQFQDHYSEVIQCYAPTNDADDEKKDDFYLQLQAIVEKSSTKDMAMMMGDFNAKIGSDNTGYEDTMGTHG